MTPTNVELIGEFNDICFEDSNRSKIDIWKRKFLKNDKKIGNLRRKNSLNSNHREKYRIQRYLLEDLN